MLNHAETLVVFVAEGETAVEDEVDEEDMEEREEDEEESQTPSTARPRRMSELHIPEKIKPIPKASSLFILQPSNKYVPSTCSTYAQRIVEMMWLALRKYTDFFFSGLWDFGINIEATVIFIGVKVTDCLCKKTLI